MLTVAKVGARVAAGYADYLEGKTTSSGLGDYYLQDGERVEAPGRWVAGASAVGCEPGVVGGSDLRELMAVRAPGTGQPLRSAGAGGEAVAALDATFSAPKSVSAVWALAEPSLREKIEGAHEAAIDRAMRYAVGQVAMVRRRVDRQAVLHAKAVDVVATSWRHTTARAVDGDQPDPQLHSHVLLHAAVRSDGKTVAIDSFAWLRHRREVGAAYRTELAYGLRRLGFEIRRQTGRGGRYFEIEGVPQALLDEWSSRHRQVQRAIEARLLVTQTARGPVEVTPAEERLAALLSRSDKEFVTTADLDRHWREAGKRGGFDGQGVKRLRTAEPRSLEAAGTPDLLSALTEFDATFTDREARAVTLERSVGVPVEKALESLDRAYAEGSVLKLANSRATTPSHRSMERAVLATATRLLEGPAEPVSPVAVERGAVEVDRRLAERGGRLSGEQRRAVEAANGGSRVVMIVGQAGTGKSTALQAVALAHRAEGRQVIVTSTAALAAERLAGDLAEVGIDALAYSTVALGRAIGAGMLDLGPESTVIHDEAALASTREQHQLLRAVQDSGARLVVVGDPNQLKPVGAGGLWAHLEAVFGERGARVELTENLRAQDAADRRDQRRFRDGEHEPAIRGYAWRHRVHVAPDQLTAEDNALEAAFCDRWAGKRALVIAQTSNEHLDELNARAQGLRREEGELGAESLPVSGRPYRLHAGDEVQVRHTIDVPGRGHLRNGTTATILQVDETRQTARVGLGANSALTLGQEQLDQADVRLAYVQHPFPAQGQTSDTAHLIVSAHATREGSYVALSRAREATHIHVGHEHLVIDGEQPLTARLAQILARSEPDLPSIATPLAYEQRLEREAERAAGEERPQLAELELAGGTHRARRQEDFGWEL